MNHKLKPQSLTQHRQTEMKPDIKHWQTLNMTKYDIHSNTHMYTGDVRLIGTLFSSHLNGKTGPSQPELIQHLHTSKKHGQIN